MHTQASENTLLIIGGRVLGPIEEEGNSRCIDVKASTAPAPKSALHPVPANTSYTVPILDELYVQGYGRVDQRLLVAICSRLWVLRLCFKDLTSNVCKTDRTCLYLGITFSVDDFPIVNPARHVSLGYSLKFKDNVNLYKCPVLQTGQLMQSIGCILCSYLCLRTHWARFKTRANSLLCGISGMEVVGRFYLDTNRKLSQWPAVFVANDCEFHCLLDDLWDLLLEHVVDPESKPYWHVSWMRLCD